MRTSGKAIPGFLPSAWRNAAAPRRVASAPAGSVSCAAAATRSISSTMPTMSAGASTPFWSIVRASATAIVLPISRAVGAAFDFFGLGNGDLPKVGS